MQELVEQIKELNKNLESISDSLGNIDSRIEHIGDKYLNEIARDLYWLAHGSGEGYIDDEKHFGIEYAIGLLCAECETLSQKINDLDGSVVCVDMSLEELGKLNYTFEITQTLEQIKDILERRKNENN